MIWVIVILLGIALAFLIGGNQHDSDVDELDSFANDCGFVNYEEYLNHQDSVNQKK